MDQVGESVDFRFNSICRIILAGCSMAGKSRWVYKFLRHADVLMAKPPNKIYYFFHANQPLFTEMKEAFGDKISFINSPPTEEMLNKIWETEVQKPIMICIDDYGFNITPEIANLFTTFSHHEDCHIILILQSLFSKQKRQRDCSLSSSHIILFKNVRDKRTAQHLGMQFAPENSKAFSKAISEMTREPYSYAIVNLQQHWPEHLRLYNRIFPDQLPIHVWVPKF